MIGEVSLFGVYLPLLIVLSAIALVLAGVLSRVFALVGVYRLFAYRPLVDLALFILLLGLLTLFIAPQSQP
ncbi:MAG: DUF1656 domain-containing protein [Sphingomonas sp.]|jgi:hypothetical protein